MLWTFRSKHHCSSRKCSQKFRDVDSSSCIRTVNIKSLYTPFPHCSFAFSCLQSAIDLTTSASRPCSVGCRFGGQSHLQGLGSFSPRWLYSLLWGFENLRMTAEKKIYPIRITISCASWSGGLFGIFFVKTRQVKAINDEHYCNTIIQLIGTYYSWRWCHLPYRLWNIDDLAWALSWLCHL